MSKDLPHDHPALSGQWTGSFQATEYGGSLVIDLETSQGHTVGAVSLWPAPGVQAPPMVGKIQAIYLGPDAAYSSVVLNPVLPSTWIVPWDQIPTHFPDHEIATLAQTSFRWDKDTMEVSWDSNIQRGGTARLTRRDPTQPSDLTATRMSWERFKRYVAGLEPRRFVFRGQQRPWRLRSHFHRSGRSDLLRYTNVDLPLLHRHLSARTRHLFNRAIHDENGAFLHLAQHYGFPTPLIDWSYSPYVAAFFAFRRLTGAQAKKRNAGYVRIYLFDQTSWRENVPTVSHTAPALPHFSMMEFLAIENERLIPQQALSALTNVDDVENFIAHVEGQHRRHYLTAVDIPVKERDAVMRELALMGVTAGSLFPGLDGAMRRTPGASVSVVTVMTEPQSPHVVPQLAPRAVRSVCYATALAPTFWSAAPVIVHVEGQPCGANSPLPQRRRTRCSSRSTPRRPLPLTGRRVPCRPSRGNRVSRSRTSPR